MALPASFDIYYYRGDTYSFYLNVRDAEGNPLDLEAENYQGLFTIAKYRGPETEESGPKEETTGTVLVIGSQLQCTIPPATGANLTNGPYVYDVQVKKSADYVYTYVTGNIYVTLDVGDE